MEKLRRGTTRLRNALEEIRLGLSQDSTGGGEIGRKRKEERHSEQRKYIEKGQENVSPHPVLGVPGNVMAPGHSLCAVGQQQERNEYDRKSRNCYASPWC